MDKAKTIAFIENSFIKPLLEDKGITDISYNGQEIFYLHNLYGRKKSDISIDENGVRDFIRQIANLTEKQFSFQNPKLDASVGKYRINAVHQSIARKNNEPCINFSIRIAACRPVITENSNFLNAELISLLKVLLKSKVSIVIGGITGSGKTEFQKYLINSLDNYQRVIVIDNILELDNLSLDNEIDFNVWQADEKNKEITIQELVKNALRSNPDWLIVAESRGKEMIEVLNSAMTGHPIMTTIHAFDVSSMPTRIARMVLMNEQKQDFDILMSDIFYNFRFYIYLRRNITKSGVVERYIEEIAEFDESGHKNTIYLNKKKKISINKITNKTLELLDYEDDENFKKYFVGEKHG